MENDNNTEEVSSFEVFEKKKIYSEKTIWGFSLFFSSIFGGVLLMQNLKDINKTKEAYTVLGLSVLFTIITIIVVNIPENTISSLPLIMNMLGGGILSKYFFPKYFPNEEMELYEMKPIWKPLLISILITIPFILALIYS